VKSRWLQWAGNAARKLFFGKHPLGRPRRRREDNINVDLKEDIYVVNQGGGWNWRRIVPSGELSYVPSDQGLPLANFRNSTLFSGDVSYSYNLCSALEPSYRALRRNRQSMVRRDILVMLKHRVLWQKCLFIFKLFCLLTDITKMKSPS
jgi:hypothetical protein